MPIRPAADRSDAAPLPGPRLGDLPLARRDVERLRQILGLQRRLRDLAASPRAQRALTHRSIFREALTWLEIHGDAPELVEHWKALLAERARRSEPVTRRAQRRRAAAAPSAAEAAPTPAGAGDGELARLEQDAGPRQSGRRRFAHGTVRRCLRRRDFVDRLVRLGEPQQRSAA